MGHTVTPINDLSKKTIWANPAALAAGKLQNKVQAVLTCPRHPLRSQPLVSDGNCSVSRCQQITFRATLIFHLIDGLLSTTAAREVRWAGVLTCGSCCLERSAPWLILSRFEELLKSHYFSQAFNLCWFLCFLSWCFSIWLTSVSHPQLVIGTL